MRTFRVHCWVKPEFSPKSIWELGMGRRTFTETRHFTDAETAMQFAENVQTSGQFKAMRGMLLLAPTEDHIEVDNTSPLEQVLDSPKSEEEMRESRRRRFQDCW